MRYGIEKKSSPDYPLLISITGSPGVTSDNWRHGQAMNVPAEDMMVLMEFMMESDTLDQLDKVFSIVEFKDHSYGSLVRRVDPSTFIKENSDE